MIIKAKIGKTFTGCVKYVLGKEGAHVLNTHHVSDEVVSHIVQDFKVVCAARPRIKNVVWHTSVSFAHSDQVNDNLMRSIADDYLKEMGLSDHQYLVVKHNDTQHPHFHIVANRIGMNGGVADDSWCKNRSAKVSDTLELKYGLTIASQVKRTLSPNVEDTLKGKAKLKRDVKHKIKMEVENCLQKGITTLEELSKQLMLKGIELKIQKRVDGTVNGISFKTDGLAVKGSSIHSNLRAKRIIEQLESKRLKQSIKMKF